MRRESSFRHSIGHVSDVTCYPTSAAQSVDMSHSLSKQSTSGLGHSGKVQSGNQQGIDEQDPTSREPTDYDVTEAIEDRSRSEDTAQSQLEHSDCGPSTDVVKSEVQPQDSKSQTLPKSKIERESENFMNEEQEAVRPYIHSVTDSKQDSTIDTLNSFAKELTLNGSRTESPLEASSGLISPPDTSDLPNFISELPSTTLDDPSRTSPDLLTQLWQPRPEALSLGSRGTSPGSMFKDDERSFEGQIGQSLDMDSEFETRAWKAYNDVENDLGLHALCAGRQNLDYFFVKVSCLTYMHLKLGFFHQHKSNKLHVVKKKL